MAERTKQRDRTKERFWRQTIKRCENSGLSVRLFCEQEELAESAFYFWRRELRKRDAENAVARRAKRSATPAFAAVTVAHSQEATQHHAIEILVRDSLRIHITRGFDARTLRDVLAVLEDRPC